MKIDKNGHLFLENSRGANSREHEAWLEKGDTCSVCDKTATCLATDGSDGEYGGPSFCCDCLKKIVRAIELSNNVNEETK